MLHDICHGSQRRRCFSRLKRTRRSGWFPGLTGTVTPGRAGPTNKPTYQRRCMAKNLDAQINCYCLCFPVSNGNVPRKRTPPTHRDRIGIPAERLSTAIFCKTIGSQSSFSPESEQIGPPVGGRAQSNGPCQRERARARRKATQATG